MLFQKNEPKTFYCILKDYCIKEKESVNICGLDKLINPVASLISHIQHISGYIPISVLCLSRRKWFHTSEFFKCNKQETFRKKY